MATPSLRALDELRERVDDAPPAWRQAFQRQLAGLRRRARQGKPWDRGLRKLSGALNAVSKRRNARLATELRPDFTLDLPVITQRDTIAEAIRDHQVVVICGETGSGKSTQLPKICVDLGRGIDGVIGHTQPRRIAARSLATRVAEESGAAVGEGVGYKIRFNDRVSDATRVKLVTDGMLLAETQGDPALAEYDTLIIDEAHERSLNIDFLLGYLKNLLPRRPDLKVIITSATIDPERFADHFGDAPIINVSGRGYPVEIRYRPLVSDDEDELDRSTQEGIVDAVDELSREGGGDILVFLPGERDIRETAETLRKHHPKGTEILPLFGRLSAAEQQRVFAPHGQRRVVLATNVAETSLTVPGIRYVIDTGLARLSRYNYRTKVQRLPIERVSQASASQRSGRCGREAPGICIRLYSLEDFESRPEYTDPEILRTNLASVILQMRYLGLGDIERFPFVEPPDPRFVRDGVKLLRELHALDESDMLTRLGRQLARLPVDPRIARILIAGEEHGCLAEVLVVAAALSIQDPRERPMDARGAADEAHARWQDRQSDFTGLLSLWSDCSARSRERSQRQFRGWCREHFLSFLRIREWRDVHRQLRELVKGMGFRENEVAAEYPPLHRALLTGFLSNIALRTDRSDYAGPRNLKLQIFPGSGVARKRPRWIVAGELVETSRVFARSVAEVRPEWIEPLAGHLVSRHHYEPFWEDGKQRVAGFEDVTLYGLPLASHRKVNFARVDPAAAREVFIREALVRGRFESRVPCLGHNRRVIAEIEALEAKFRRRDVLVSEDALYAFYAECLPETVVDGPTFERWARDPANDHRLRMDSDFVTANRRASVSASAFPDSMTVNGVRLPLEYHFQPGHPEDGVTAIVPVAGLNQLRPEPFEWLVPGLVAEKISAMIRALPKQLRKNFVPAPDFAQAALDALSTHDGSLVDAVRAQLQRMTGVEVPLDAWDRPDFPAHLWMYFRVVDEAGERLGAGRDLVALQEEFADRARASFSGSAGEGLERAGLTHWTVGDLDEHVAFEQGGVTLRGYPALVDEGRTVALRLLDSPDAAALAHRGGVRRLLMLALPDQTRYLRRGLTGIERLTLLHQSVGGAESLREDIAAATFDRVFLTRDVPRTRARFERLRDARRGGVVDEADRLVGTLADVLERHHALRGQLKGNIPLAEMSARQDIQEQLAGLVYPGFVRATPPVRLADLPRYLEGIERRLTRLARDPSRDEPGRALIRAWMDRVVHRWQQHERKGIRDPQLDAFRWLLEEYRISLFAQELGTREKVSEKRLEEAWARVR